MIYFFIASSKLNQTSELDKIADPESYGSGNILSVYLNDSQLMRSVNLYVTAVQAESLCIRVNQYK